MKVRLVQLVVISSTLFGCQAGSSETAKKPNMSTEAVADMADIADVADEYVKLVLGLGRHDADYVDAYLGPKEWKAEAETRNLTVLEIRERAEELLARLASSPPETSADELGRLRHKSLVRTLEALVARARMLSGETISFDEESTALYDARAPQRTAEDFEAVLRALEETLPGSGSLSGRVNDFKEDFVIPTDKLDQVFAAAIAACREKTAKHIDLPEAESFVVEYVTDKSWSGYNWYKGNYHSLIQVNTDLPIYIDRALDLACHEGYPGHHVYNLLVERELVNERSFREFLVYPLFSPRSLIAEGTANFGIEVAFPSDERIAFEREVLFPLAGLDSSRTDKYYEVQALLKQLNYSGNEAARRYLNGEIDAEAAAKWLEDYSLSSPARAKQRIRFFDQYRSYVINYNLGQDLVRDYIEERGGTGDKPDERWRLFTDLLSRPYLPSDLT